nr:MULTISPECIES: hypothetical protein [Pseudomonas]
MVATPTGSSKTLTAFLAILDALFEQGLASVHTVIVDDDPRTGRQQTRQSLGSEPGAPRGIVRAAAAAHRPGY